MNAWPFVIGAYAITLIAIALLLLTSFLSMRRAEAEADRLRGHDR